MAAFDLQTSCETNPQECELFVSWAGNVGRRFAEAWIQVLSEVLNPAPRVFFSDRSLLPGAQSPIEQIVKALNNCSVFLCMIDRGAFDSHWVTWETAYASGREALVIPIFSSVSPDEVPSPVKLLYQGISTYDIGAHGPQHAATAVTVIAETLGSTWSGEFSRPQIELLKGGSTTPRKTPLGNGAAISINSSTNTRIGRVTARSTPRVVEVNDSIETDVDEIDIDNS